MSSNAAAAIPLERVSALYVPPFKYDPNNQAIYDGDDRHVLDVRGWGRIQYMDGAEALQDAAGERIVSILNEHWRSTRDE